MEASHRNAAVVSSPSQGEDSFIARSGAMKQVRVPTATSVDSSHAPKPLEPEHPLMLDGQMAPGSIDIMFRCMIEEMLMIGMPASRLAAMTRDPNYQGLFAARQTLGNARTDALLNQTLARVGQHHHHTAERGGDTRPATLTVGCS